MGKMNNSLNFFVNVEIVTCKIPGVDIEEVYKIAKKISTQLQQR